MEENDIENAIVVSQPHSSLATELQILFNGELNPVAPKAQKKVPVPEGYLSFSF